MKPDYDPCAKLGCYFQCHCKSGEEKTLTDLQEDNMALNKQNQQLQDLAVSTLYCICIGMFVYTCYGIFVRSLATYVYMYETEGL